MSTALVSTFFHDFSDVLSKNTHYNAHKPHIKISERKSVPNFMTRRSSTSSSSGSSSCSSSLSSSSSSTSSSGLLNNNNNNNNVNNNNNNNKVSNGNTTTTLAAAEKTSSTVSNNSQSSHRKLDRSLSEPVERSSGGGGGSGGGQRSNNQANSSRYKTELCRPFEESGKCKYGDKCQFAHGAQELRTLARHPKYKTELCRTFHTIGFCPYGPRCHFIHNAESQEFRPKALSVGSSSGESTASSLSESPTSLYDDLYPTTPTANNAFTFNSQDFSMLVSPATLALAANNSSKQRVQQQNAYNTALNQFSLAMFNSQRSLNINELDTVFTDTSPPHPPSPVESVTSDMDELSLCGSSPTDSTGIRLPIFNRLSTSED